MTNFKLSSSSKSNLSGVHPRLVVLVEHAIKVTEVDFGVIEGLRDIETQREYVRKGVSQTMNSKHLTGDAVDLLAYIGARGSWELPLYYEIAEAIRLCARELDIGIRWGGAWHIPDIRCYCGSMKEANEEYVELRRSQNRKPFIDAPHFERSE